MRSRDRGGRRALPHAGRVLAVHRHPLNRYIGYENAAAVAKKALKEGKTIRQVVLECGYVTDGRLTEVQLDAALDVLAMTHPPHLKD